MASLATSVGAEPSVRFAIDYAEEQPKISDACKNFLAYRIAQAKTDANASPADADRAARLTMLCGRKAMRAVNAAAPTTGDAAAAYAAKGDALATRTFGRASGRGVGCPFLACRRVACSLSSRSRWRAESR